MRAGGSSWILSSEPQPLAGRAASFILIPTFPKRLAGVWFMNDKSYVSVPTSGHRCHAILGLQTRTLSLGEMR